MPRINAGTAAKMLQVPAKVVYGLVKAQLLPKVGEGRNGEGMFELTDIHRVLALGGVRQLRVLGKLPEETSDEVDDPLTHMLLREASQVLGVSEHDAGALLDSLAVRPDTQGKYLREEVLEAQALLESDAKEKEAKKSFLDVPTAADLLGVSAMEVRRAIFQRRLRPTGMFPDGRFILRREAVLLLKERSIPPMAPQTPPPNMQIVEDRRHVDVKTASVMLECSEKDIEELIKRKELHSTVVLPLVEVEARIAQLQAVKTDTSGVKLSLRALGKIQLLIGRHPNKTIGELLEMALEQYE